MRAVLITGGDANEEFVAQLWRNGARFFIIGGTATHFHVPDREWPSDLDIIVEPSADMLAKLDAALVHVGEPPLPNLSLERFMRLPPIHLPYKGNQDVLYMDIFTPSEGVDFSEHWTTADEAMVRGVAVRVASNATMQTLLRLGIEKERDQQPEKAEKYARDLALLDEAARRRT